MTRSSSRRVAVLVVAAALLTSPFAHAAPPTPADLESARALYVSGRELRDAGNLGASLEKLKAAHALVPTPITALELALAYALTGQPLEGRQIALSIERLPVAPDESKKAASARIEARELEGRLAAEIASVAVSVANAPASEIQILIDGEAVPAEALSVPRKVNPGKHVVAARTPTQETSLALELKPAELRLVTLDFVHAAPVKPSAASVVAAPELEPAAAGSSARSRWLTASLLVAGAGALVGASTGAVAWAVSSDLHSSCEGGQCPPDAHGDLSLVRTTATVSTVAFAVAGAGAVAALSLWLLAPSAPPRRAALGMRAYVGGIEGVFP